MSAVLVIGGGHNGLAAALRLAKGGRSVTVLEASDAVGGTAAGAEFAPGYRHRGVLHDTHVRPETVAALGLQLSLGARPPQWAQGPEGAFSFTPPTGILDEVGDFARSVMLAAPPEIGTDAPVWPLAKRALAMRRLGADTMMELLRLGPQSIDDVTSELLDTTPSVPGKVGTLDQTRAIWMLPALVGSWCGALSPETAANLFLYEILGTHEVPGGPAAVVAALESAAKAAGVTIRTGARVERIHTGKTGVSGVSLAGGERIDANFVLSAIGPRVTLLDLVPPPWLEAKTERDIADVRVRGIDGKVHLALSAPIQMGGATPDRIAVVDHPFEIEAAFDGCKYNELSTKPLPLDVRQYTDGCPSGHAVLSILVHGVPYATDPAQLRDAVLRSLERVCPDIRDRVVGDEVLTPQGLSERFGLEGGHLFHGERLLDQMWVMRPTSQLAQYSVRGVRGLFVGSSGCHPGGTVSCAPGLLAAEALLGG